MKKPDSVINIISNGITENRIAGYIKVAKHLAEGFKQIGQPYVVNKDMHQFKYNYIHDNMIALIEAARYNIPAVAGPNLAVLPRDLPAFLPKMPHILYLHPSEWCVDVWKELHYKLSPLDYWPTGIDMNTFPLLRDNPDPDTVMIYVKKRPKSMVDSIIDAVTRNNLKYNIIQYGSYDEKQYKEAIAASAFGIWAGTTESQGIGLQESLTAGLPLIVIDNKSVFDQYAKNTYIFPKTVRNDIGTSAPYFDNRCGVIIESMEELDKSIKEMKNKFSTYKPRDYIEETLSLEKSAEWMLRFFDRLDFDTYPHGEAVPDEPYRDLNYSTKTKLIFQYFVLRRKFRTSIRLMKLKLKNR